MNGAQACKEVINQVKMVISGKDDVLYLVMAGIIGGGHILIDDIPGVGKTTMAKAFAASMDLENNRIQFTTDVMPSDVVGFTMYDKEKNAFIYKDGAVACNLLLADEINRTSSKTQSALLEVMEEGKITVDGKSREIPKPFTVIATQNPIGSIGTSLLPESQLDRFMFCISMGYPEMQDEIEMVMRRQEGYMSEITPVIQKDHLLQIQSEVQDIYIHEKMVAFIVQLVRATREHKNLALGISPRGTLAIVNAAKAVAYMEGREYVVPDDVKKIFYAASRHRVILSGKAKTQGIKVKDVLEQIYTEVAAQKN